MSPAAGTGRRFSQRPSAYRVPGLEEARAIIEPLLGDGRLILFLSTWALSETPLKAWATVEDLLRRASGWLLAFQARFSEVNDRGYFEGLVDARPDAEIGIMDITQVPVNAYVFFRARSPADS